MFQKVIYLYVGRGTDTLSNVTDVKACHRNLVTRKLITGHGTKDPESPHPTASTSGFFLLFDDDDDDKG